MMNKAEKKAHDQKLINSYNKQIEEIDRMIAKSDTFSSMLLFKRRRSTLKRLMKLYGTEKYGLV